MKRTMMIGLAASLLMACGGAKPTESDWVSRGSRASRTHVEVAQLDEGCDVATIYFGYDSADLDTHSQGELQRLAACVSNGRTLPVHLVGAADPRGTEEYNLALGERRAQTVRGYLLGLGLPSDTVTYASVGEEMAMGTNEATWALDRHVMPVVREQARGLERPVMGYSNDLDRPRFDAHAVIERAKREQQRAAH